MVKTISMEKFVEKNTNENLNILDVREMLEYKFGGHIPGAKNMALSILNQTASKLDKNKEYYIICQSGARSAQACAFLEQAGFKTTNVLGGMSMWNGKKER